MSVENELKKIVKVVNSRIIDPENNYVKLVGLIENAHIENKLLNISSFEQISFNLYQDQIDFSITPNIERLSMVHPPSFECIFPILLSGYYLVKYPTSSMALPMQLSAFLIEYVVILIQDKDTYHFKNEHVRLSENH